MFLPTFFTAAWQLIQILLFFYSKTELLQNCPNAHFFRQKNSPNCFIFVEIQNSVHFRPQNNPFEQGHRGAEIGQIYRAEQQDCDQTIKQHQSFLQNCFPEKELRPHNQQNRKNDREKQRDQEHGGQFPADEGSLPAARYAQPVNHRIIFPVPVNSGKLLKGQH